MEKGKKEETKVEEEILTPQEYDQAYEQELVGEKEEIASEEDKGIDKEKSVDEEPEKDKSESPDETPEKAEGNQGGEETEPEGFTVPDNVKASLDYYGLGITVNEKNLSDVNLILDKLGAIANLAGRYAKQNKDLSEQYKKLKKEHETTRQSIPPEVVLDKAFEGVELSKEEQEVFDDPGTKKLLGRIVATLGGGAPRTLDEVAGGEKTEPELTEEQKAEMEQTIKTTAEAWEKEVMSVHSDCNELLATPEFGNWLKGKHQDIQLKLVRPQTPYDLISVLDSYKYEMLAKKKADEEKQKKSNELGDAVGHGDIGSGPGSGEEDIDYLSMSDEDFEKLDRKVRANVRLR